MKTKSILFVFLVMLFLINPLLYAQSKTEEGPKVGPVNPEFIKFQENMSKGILPDLTEGGYPLGYVPSPVDFSRMQPVKNENIPWDIALYNATFDLRTQSKLSAVRNQGDCGACWTFATYASLESYLLPAQSYDFSEQHMNVNHGFDLAECAGGNFNMSSAYLLRWTGPILENEVPYPYDLNNSPNIDSVYTKPKHIQQVMYLPTRQSYTDNDHIKYCLTNYGAVQCSVYWSDAYYNSSNASYYFNTAHSTNHAVAIVGWNDNYPASNFNVTAPGNGAFIVRNSWGSSWGDSGYFYLSYYDATLKYLTSFNNAESVSNYDKVYQYDPLGWVNGYGWGDTVTWGCNMFTAEETTYIKSVGFYLVNSSEQYDIYIYTNSTAGVPRSGTLAATKSGSKMYAGYYTIALDSPVAVTAGQRFSIVVKFTTPVSDWQVPIEYAYSNYSSAAAADTNQSYISHDGDTWYDLYSSYTANACIKAYTGAAPAITVTSPNGGESWTGGSVHAITWTSSGFTGNVLLEYTKTNGAGWTTIGTVANTGTYNWTVANVTSSQCKIRVSCAADRTISDTSDNVFTMTGTGLITVTSPNGGESWGGGSIHPITWTSSGITGNVILEYTKTNGAGWTTIATGVSNTGTYNWTVPNFSSTQCKIRVTSVANRSILDTSNNLFSISASPAAITVTSPNGGESWVGDSVHAITWTSSGVTGNILLEYSKTNGAGWTTITSAAPNTGTYNWRVPNISSSLYKIRVTSASNRSVYDDSNSTFTVTLAPIAVTSPNGGETWIGGSVHAITWTSNGLTGNVILEYTKTNGVGWTTIATGVPNTGSYTWTVPLVSSTVCKIRVTSGPNRSIYDESNSTFTIQ